MASVTSRAPCLLGASLQRCSRGRVRQSVVAVTISPTAHGRPAPIVRSFRTSSSVLAAKKPPIPIPRDATIPHRVVQLVSATDNSLGPPVDLASILSSYNPQTHTLTLVSQDPPIVKLVEKREAQLKMKATEDKARKRRARAMETSELQVSWESARGDMEHKVALARGILERGDRLELVFAHKKGARGQGLLAGAKLEAARQAALELFETELESVGKQWKDPLVTQSMTALYYEPSKDLRDEVIRRADEADDEKAREKERKKEERRKKEEERAKKAAHKAAQQ